MKIRIIVDTENPGAFRGYDDATGEELDMVYVFAKWSMDGPEVAVRWRNAPVDFDYEMGRGKVIGTEHATATARARFDL